MYKFLYKDTINFFIQTNLIFFSYLFFWGGHLGRKGRLEQFVYDVGNDAPDHELLVWGYGYGRVVGIFGGQVDFFFSNSYGFHYKLAFNKGNDFAAFAGFERFVNNSDVAAQVQFILQSVPTPM